MIKQAELLDAVNRLLTAGWPERMVYREDVPTDFKRPSFLLEMISFEPLPVTPVLLDCNAFITITGFETLDVYKKMDTGRLMLLQTELLTLFAGGKLTVGNRSLNIHASGGGLAQGECFVDLQLDYLDEAAGFAPTAPPMGQIKTNIKIGGTK